MAYPTHYLLQFGGPRGDAAEELWTCGIRMIAVGGQPDLGDTKEYLDDVCVPALRGWIARGTSHIGSNAKLNFAKLNRIGPDGTYAETATVANFFPTPVNGGTPPVGAALVPQAAVALTWETAATNRGLACRGRIYSPAPAVTGDASTGLFLLAHAADMAESAAQLVSDLRGSGGAGAMTPNIVSDGGAGVAHRIDRCAVDNRVDIIRKRANGLSPVRVRTDVPA